MAQPKKKSFYTDRIKEIKQQFREKTGKRPTQKALKTEPSLFSDLKRIEKNLKDWGLRRKKRIVKNRTKKASKIVRAQERPNVPELEKALPDSIVQMIAFDEVFHVVLSYGGKVERAIEDALNEAERLGFKVKLRIEHFEWGRPRFYTSRLSMTLAFQELYIRCLVAQKEQDSSTAVLVRAFSQDKAGERTITVQTYLQ